MTSNLRLFAVGMVCSGECIIVSEADVAPSSVTSWAGFVTGYNQAIRGADLADMQTADEIAGWRHAREPRYK